ncbi:VapE domain-containing protein [Massilia sp. CFBP9026]|uniref:VapE domain-containing protein n=1 Tax=Massilia sp. CFBP9026 TaxID=3096536 RepID=UPI002A6A22BA|nr:VapE domain-containing protein [Massilia sp. CFBP9026]MDY0965411.1 VapE family protein [Massilia sp. CFBP9026]
MTGQDFIAVGRAALNQIETLLAEWFPNGVREGHEFCIGSRDGEAGQSLRIRLTGDKAGVWSDFSDGEAGGDLISLYAFVNSLSPGRACAALAERLGIPLTPRDKPSGNGSAPIVLKPKQSPIRTPAQAGKGVEAPAEKKSRTPWEPMLPVPQDAGSPPKAHVVRGRPEASWEYHDVDGQLLGVIYRFLRSDGGKEVLPCVYARNADSGRKEWRWMAFPEPRPLYLRGPHRPELPVLVLEGEKCVDKAVGLPAVHENFEVLTWSGGGKAVKKSDWSAIRSRNVILWADADAKVYKEGHEYAGQIMPECEQPGMVAMVQVAAILQAQDCSVFFIDIPAPGDVADGWDIADLIDGGATEEQVVAWLTRLRVDQAAEDDDELVQEPSADDVPAWVAEQLDAAPAGTSTPLPAGAGVSKKQLRQMLIQTANGGVKGCRENVYMVMENDPRLIGLVGLDMFSGLQMKRRPTPWPSETGEWTESDDFRLGMYMAEHHSLVLASIGDIERGVAQAAREHSFNPVVDYFDRCASMWDGQARVATAFTRYWGAADSEYLRLVATMFFIGIVVRGYRPGVKNDHAPVFEGGQGRGKSTALKVLGGDWFADTPFRMGEKDGYLSIQGVLLYEVAELEQFNRSEVTAIKAFMSSTVDRFREPYGRRMKNMPRRCAFAATTNEDAYFKDSTGNRRFWPVETGRLDIEALIADRDQLFGEAIALMNTGVQWWPTYEQQQRLISPMQESREIPDPWHGRVYEYLEGMDTEGKPTMVGKVMRITARELLTRALHFELSKMGPARAETMRIGAIMRKLGWSKERSTEGAREYFYERPKAAPAGAEVGNGLPG